MTIRADCQASFEANRHDCSGFARAVAALNMIPLTGLANDIVAMLCNGGSWTPLANGVEASKRAEAGDFVLAGLRGDAQANKDIHGHVVVVTGSPLAKGKYPSAWWGSLGGTPGQEQTLNYAWTEADRDRVSYAVWEA